MARDKLRFVFIQQNAPPRPVEWKPSPANPRHTPDTSGFQSLRAWFARIGGIAILLGGLGLIKTFYVPSVVAVYVGLAVLAVDALYEKLPSSAKVVWVFVALALTYLFTRAVVLHKNPMQYEYGISGDQVAVEIRNDSLEDDYEDVDLVITPSAPHSDLFVGHAELQTNYQGCAVVRDQPGVIPNGHTSEILIPDEHTVIDWTDYVRIRCAKLPRSFSILVDIHIVKGEPGTTNLPKPAAPNGIPQIKGKFTARFRTVEVDTKAEAL